MNDKVLNIHHNLILSAFTVMGDVLICIALYCMFCKVSGHILEDDFMQSVVVVAAIYFSCVINGGVILYKRNVKDFQVPLLVLRNIIVFTIASVILLKIGGFYLLPLNLSVLFLLSQLIVASTFRLTIRRIVKAYRTKEEHKHHAVLLGSKENIRALYDEMVSVPYFGYAVEGYFDYERASNMPESCPYLGTPDDMLGNVPYLSLYRDPLEKVENRAIKRTFDILFSLAFLCTIFPIVFVIVFIITKLTMPGPVFFRQKRNGINGEEFYCIKFRSMRVNAQADTLQATKDDPRKTKWGNIMRKTNIDELPQFINVLKGDMSIVGPRPHMLKHTEEYSKLIDKYMMRHFVKPGITGWSQVTGYRGETKELCQMEGRVKGDIYYIEHWSIWLDIYIIYKTVANAIKGDEEAY